MLSDPHLVGCFLAGAPPPPPGGDAKKGGDDVIDAEFTDKK
jgi:hypothetical protein